MTYKMRESDLQNKCIKYLKSKKIYHLNLFGDGFTGKGKPDVIVCLNGEFIAFELKVGKNGLQDDQVVHRNRILHSGGKHFAPRTINEFKEIIENENKKRL